MALYVDENLPVEITDLLRQAGYMPLPFFKQHLEGSTDSDIDSVCQEEWRILVTLDTDFADIRAHPPSQFPGLIVLHLHRQDKHHILRSLSV